MTVGTRTKVTAATRRGPAAHHMHFRGDRHNETADRFLLIVVALFAGGAGVYFALGEPERPRGGFQISTPPAYAEHLGQLHQTG